MFTTLLVFSTLVTLTFCQFTLPMNLEQEANLFCNLCHSGLSLVQNQLVVLESVTKNNLGAVVNKLCQAAPKDLPIVEALCTVLKENLVDALVTLVKGVKEQSKPELLCGYFQLCDKVPSF